MSHSPGKFVIFKSHLSQSGWRGEKWPAGFSNRKLTVMTEQDEKDLTPFRVIDLTKKEWRMTIKKLMELYPPPENKDAYKPRKEVDLGRNTRDVS